MRLIATKQGKTDKYDRLRCVRHDDSASDTMMPRQGILPHDLIHYVVETTLGYEHGFLGLVSKGAALDYAAAQSHDIASRMLADQAIHAEAIVESLQAQLWSGAFDREMFLAGVDGACGVRGKRAPDLDGIDVENDLYGKLLALEQRWQQVPFHSSLEFDMPGL